ncbi:MAG: phosphonate C-P lyase system protein PhnH [Pseudomonadota bacterium]
MGQPLASPSPSPAELRSNAAFEALLWALSRPGQLRALGGEGAIVEALIDRECTVYATDPAVARGAERLGAALVGAGEADYVFAGALPSTALLGELKQGSDLHPEGGATLILAAGFMAGDRLRLSGPGVDGALSVTVGGVPAGFWARRTQLMRYPMGFDIFLCDGAQVMGVPRSTAVEAF